MKVSPKRINGHLNWDEVLKVNIPRFFKEFKTLKDLLPRLAVTLIPTADDQTVAAVVHKALKKKLKDDPDFEVWMKAKYFPYTRMGTNKKEPTDFDFLMVSNKGRFFDIRHYDFLSGHVSKRGYQTVSINGYIMSAHRLVCYLFNPLPQHLLNYPIGELEANHKDKVKDNNDFSNLEWTTPEENRAHAMGIRLITPQKAIEHPTVIPMVAKVVDIPKFNGTEFVVIGQQMCEAIGINHKVLFDMRERGDGKTYKGCEWRAISKEEIDQYSQEVDPKLIKALKNYTYERTGRANPSKQKWLYTATHLETGEVIQCKGTTGLLENGFMHQNVGKVIKGDRKSHKGYTFTVTPLNPTEDEKENDTLPLPD